MSKLKDLTGRRFGKLVVIGRVANRGARTFWGCRCDCGDGHEAWGYHLVKGAVRSCGCMRERVVEVNGARYSQSGLARELGVSRQAVNQWVKIWWTKEMFAEKMREEIDKRRKP